MLNILPPEKKDSLRQVRIYVRVRLLCLLATSVMVALSALVLTTNILLKQWQVSLTNQAIVAGISDTDRDTLQAKLSNLTIITTGITSVNTKFNNPLPLLVAVVQNLPSSIHLTSINLDYTTGKVDVTGVVDDRTALLTLQQQLFATNELTNIELPINDFTVKNNIPFTLNATISNAKTTL